MSDSTTVLHPVPYFSQWESARMVPELISGAVRASEDPLWQKSGAASAAEYEYWSARTCGMACLRMALAHWKRDAPPSMSLATECLEAGAYVREGEKLHGLLYAPFAAYVERRWGLFASVRPRLDIAEIESAVRQGDLVMLSVHKSIRTLDPEPPGKGGHLVLAVGVHEEGVFLHNPSGLPGRSQDFAYVGWSDLDRFFAGRGVVLGDTGV